MVWKMKKGIMRSCVYGKGVLVARISKKMGGYYIADASGENMLSILRNIPCHLEISGNGGEGSAEIQLAEETSFLCPPRAECLILQWERRFYRIEQSVSRDFRIFHTEAEIGRIENMLKRMPKLDLQDGEPPEFAALIFALADCMLHEDDVYIV